jgi:hypothetical protein
MRPYSVYIFEKVPEFKTRYILTEHSGVEIADFPAVWIQKNHQYVGEKYIVFQPMNIFHARQRFTHALSLEKSRMVTGLKFTTEFPRLSWGDYGKDAILIEFSEDWNELTILFFEGLKPLSYSLFERAVAGELIKIAECNILPLPMGA